MYFLCFLNERESRCVHNFDIFSMGSFGQLSNFALIRKWLALDLSKSKNKNRAQMGFCLSQKNDNDLKTLLLKISEIYLFYNSKNSIFMNI